MGTRRKLWWFFGLLLLAGAVGIWYGEKSRGAKDRPAPVPLGALWARRLAGPIGPHRPGWKAGHRQSSRRAVEFVEEETGPAAGTNGSRAFRYRLSNTGRSVEELARVETGLLLKNALIDTREPVALGIPEHLRARVDPGSYVVQARGTIDREFVEVLAGAGARVVSYIPNNAYLVRVGGEGAQQLRGQGRVQTVLGYEPYYKFVEEDLLERAVRGQPLAEQGRLNVVLFEGEREAGLAEMAGLGARVVGEEHTPFGPMLVVEAGMDRLAALAQLTSVQGIEWHRERVLANDLARVRVGVSTNAAGLLPGGSHLGLTGTNVMVNVNDTGVDTNHPDLNPRVYPADPTDFNLVNDPDGHGTHVAGIIASSGGNDGNVRARGSVTNADFRGMAPGAGIFSQPIDAVFGPPSDEQLQENAARTNYFVLGRRSGNAALISNNSWVYPGAFDYNFAAASYDAAVRDGLRGVAGMQPLLFVFAAGNEGFGSSGGQGGQADSIESPGTGKNVITVGAIDQPRAITNVVTINGVTRRLFLGLTDSSNEVASFSSRGNVGVGIEGASGRFKPDVVAPGAFVVSTRSTQWDTNAYYRQLGDLEVNRIGLQQVEAGETNYYVLYVPTNAIALGIRVAPNNLSPSPFPGLPVHLRLGQPPTTADYQGNNQARVSNPGSGSWQYSIGNPGVQPVAYDIETILVLTNEPGTLLEVLRTLNEELAGTNGPAYYRYETGTSQAAPVVSGVLALMQEFYEQRVGQTNSPALMKGLLINGARSLSAFYDLQVQSGINRQGWGLVNLTNVLPNTNVAGWPVRMVDQSPTNVLGTGQSHTYEVGVSAAGTNVPMRVTLVWTDPPGNPVGGIKLVNDLDLVVTNLDNPAEVYYGNNIPVGSDFNDLTTSSTVKDVVNNVENVYIGPRLRGRNYSITVRAHRVNVNAVTANTNDIVQDYALVVSSGNGTGGNGITRWTGPVRTRDPGAFVFRLTNNAPLLSQRVAANSQFITTTNGQTNQWNFYIFDHTNNFTNLAFVTFLPPNLSRPRHVDADIDLYVSTDSGLTNLTTASVNGARKSRGRSGIEAVVYSNAVPGAYYVGVKSEDQQAANFGLFGIASEEPFSQRDALGNLIVRGVPVGGVDIPDGTPTLPGGAVMVGFALGEPITMRRVVVTNTITHENMGDLLVNLSHDNTFAVLNNHTFGSGGPITRFIYEDAGERDIFPVFVPPDMVKHSDGPGSLEAFVGQEGIGVWLLTMVDNSPFHTGRVENLTIRLEPQVLTNNPAGGIPLTIAASGSFCDTIDVPADAISLTVYVVPEDPGTTVQVLARRGSLPTINQFDKAATINYPGGALTLTTGDVPPLNPGRYFICIVNADPSSAVKVRIFIRVDRVPHPILAQLFSSTGSVPLLDDAATNSTIHVPYNLEVATVQVGVRINHPRVSDLVLSLVSPQGTRILLAENRGGPRGTNYGSGNLTTNAVAANAGGGIAAATAVVGPVQTIGIIHVEGDFGGSFADTMHIYYEGALIFDSGPTSDTNLVFDILYGPGSSTNITIIMNEGGNPNANTQWSYTATVLSGNYVYATFTENTNLTTMPIKFAPPPFTTNANVFTNILLGSDFDSVTPGNYGAGQLVDGWAVQANEITVLADTIQARSLTNLLLLRSGRISRIVPTVIGKRYGWVYSSRGPGLVSWWPGESNAVDIIGGNNGTMLGGVTFVPAVVGRGFNFNGNSYVSVPDNASLDLPNEITLELWYLDQPLTNTFDTGLFCKRGIGVGPCNFGINVVPSGIGIYYNDPMVDYPANNSDDVQGIYESSRYRIPALGVFHHFVATYKPVGANQVQVLMYIDGLLVKTKVMLGTLSRAVNNDIVTIGAEAATGGRMRGIIDEPSVFSRALTTVEITDIYNAGAAGKGSPITNRPNAQVVINGITNTIIGSNTWIVATNAFAAISNGTPVQMSGHTLSMLFDSFKLVELENNVYYLPEESLARLVGENAFGDWHLEVWDTRAGATNQNALLSWQLDLSFTATNRPARRLISGAPLTGTLSTNQMACFIVDVPLAAAFATNYVNSTGPVSLWFGTNGLPDGSNPGDFLLVSGVTSATILIATNGTFLLSPSNTIMATISTNSPPVLTPGQRYYLCLFNSNPTNQANNYTIQVDFDNTAGAFSAVRLHSSAFTHALLPRTPLPHYYQVTVSSNAAAVSFEVIGADENVTLVLSRGQLPTFLNYDYASAGGSSGDRQIIVTPGSLVPLAPGEWFLAVYNESSQEANYSIRVMEYEETGGSALGKPVRLLSLTEGGAGATPGVVLDGVLGQRYRVEYSGDLMNWNELTNFLATNVIVAVPDPTPMRVTPQRFYRAVQNPGP